MDFWDIIVFLLIVCSVIAVGAKYLYKVLNCVYQFYQLAMPPKIAALKCPEIY